MLEPIKGSFEEIVVEPQTSIYNFRELFFLAKGRFTPKSLSVSILSHVTAPPFPFLRPNHGKPAFYRYYFVTFHLFHFHPAYFFQPLKNFWNLVSKTSRLL